MNEVTIDGVVYVPKAEKPTGKRAVIVIDRGWIIAGDVKETNGRIRLSRCIWVFRWESIGIDGVIKDPKSSKVTLKKIDDVDIPSGSEVFRIAVGPEWGL